MSELKAVLAESIHTHNEETLITEIYKLQAENKALKEKRYDIKLMIRLKKIEESRDELLTFLIRIKSDSNWPDWAFDHRDDEIQEGELEEHIKKAEALKEKEA